MLPSLERTVSQIIGDWGLAPAGRARRGITWQRHKSEDSDEYARLFSRKQSTISSQRCVPTLQGYRQIGNFLELVAAQQAGAIPLGSAYGPRPDVPPMCSCRAFQAGMLRAAARGGSFATSGGKRRIEWMPAAICMLRGVNVGGHNSIKMESLRTMCESLGLRGAQTYVQSGNVVFKTTARDLSQLAKRIETKIEQTYGFRPTVIIRSTSELREVIGKNPFASRSGIEPSRLLVTFLATHPAPEVRDKMLGIKADPEELRIVGREVYAYFPNGIGRAKLSPALIERTLKTPGTGRNWNTVTKLLEMAEKLEAS